MLAQLRYAVRQLIKSPGFTFVAVLGLALGIGANVALFSVVNSVFLRPLAFQDPDRLVRLSSTNEEQNFVRVGFSYPRFLEVQQRQDVFSHLSLSAFNAFTLTGKGDPQQVIGIHTTTALLLASLGVYSVMAHLVTFRTAEIGIRMALGASPGAVLRMVLGHGRRLTLIGIALGIASGVAVSRLLQQVLFEVDPTDPVIYLVVSVTLLLVAEIASFLPARRATRIDPVIALRTE